MKVDVVKLREEFKDPHHLYKSSDGNILFIREWKAQSPTKIAILIFHGITAYSELYSEMLATPLVNAGYNIYGLDLRGHGLSDGNRGDMPSKDRLVKDISEMISFLKEKYERLIILGHSLGVITATIATNHCLEKIDGLILLSAGRTIREGVYKKPSLGKTLKILFSSIVFPSKPVITYYRNGLSGLEDPLRNFKYTLRFMRILSAKAVVFPNTLEIPVLVGVGDQDEIFAVGSSKALYDEIPSDNKEFMIVEGAKHAEFPEGSWKELIEWLKKNFK